MNNNYYDDNIDNKGKNNDNDNNSNYRILQMNIVLTMINLLTMII